MEHIRFEDGDAYERGMAPWSRLAGETFLTWLASSSHLRWVDVGCGTGSFAALISERCAPVEVQGVDPSEGQLAIARQRPGARGTAFLQGDAMALPFERQRFDAAVMALVIFFVPDPAKGVAEMARVVRPGGLVAAYVGCARRWLSLRPDLGGDPGGRCSSPPSSQSIRRRIGGASRCVDSRGTRGGRNARDHGGAHVLLFRGLLGDEHDYGRRASDFGGNVGRATR
jgi:SAM-dependent methyltransferase